MKQGSEDEIEIVKDTCTGKLYSIIPLDRAKVLAMKSGYFPKFLECREEIAGITKQYITVQDSVNVLNGKLNDIIVNNDFLLLDRERLQNENLNLKSSIKKKTFWGYVKDAAIVGLAAKVIASLL